MTGHTVTEDPDGKRALFDPSPGSEAARAVKPTKPVGNAGKGALFSAAERQPGTVVMHCSDCGARSRVGLVEYAWRHLPFWLWIPGKKYSRLLRCAACDQLAWQDVSFFA